MAKLTLIIKYEIITTDDEPAAFHLKIILTSAMLNTEQIQKYS